MWVGKKPSVDQSELEIGSVRLQDTLCVNELKLKLQHRSLPAPLKRWPNELFKFL